MLSRNVLIILFISCAISITTCDASFWGWLTGNNSTEQEEITEQQEVNENEIIEETVNQEYVDMTAEEFLRPGTIISGPTRIHGPDA